MVATFYEDGRTDKKRALEVQGFSDDRCEKTF